MSTVALSRRHSPAVWAVGLVLAVLLGGSAAVLLQAGASSPDPAVLAHSTDRLAVNGLPPDLATRSLTGAPVHAADFRGHLTVVTFFGSWCAPCRAEAATVRDLPRSAPAGVRFLGIATGDTTAGAAGFVHRYGWQLPVVVDPAGQFAHTMRVVGTPTTVVIRPDGKVAAVVSGAITPASFRSALAKAAA